MPKVHLTRKEFDALEKRVSELETKASFDSSANQVVLETKGKSDREFFLMYSTKKEIDKCLVIIFIVKQKGVLASLEAIQNTYKKLKEKPGNIYDKLMKLEKKGYIDWEKGEKGKKIYRLTESGLEMVNKLKKK